MGPTLRKHKEPGEPGGKGGQHQRTERAFAPSRPPHGERVGAEGREKARAKVPLLLSPAGRNKPCCPIGGYHFLLPEETLLPPFLAACTCCPRPGGLGRGSPLPAPSEQGLTEPGGVLGPLLDRKSKWCRRAGPDLRDLAKPVDKWSEHLVLRGDRRADVVRSAERRMDQREMRSMGRLLTDVHVRREHELDTSVRHLAPEAAPPRGGSCREGGSAGPQGSVGSAASPLCPPPSPQLPPPPREPNRLGAAERQRALLGRRTQRAEGRPDEGGRSVPQSTVGASAGSLPPALGRGRGSAHALPLARPARRAEPSLAAAGPIRAWERSPARLANRKGLKPGAEGGARLRLRQQARDLSQSEHSLPPPASPRVSGRAQAHLPVPGPLTSVPGCQLVTWQAPARERIELRSKLFCVAEEQCAVCGSRRTSSLWAGRASSSENGILGRWPSLKPYQGPAPRLPATEAEVKRARTRGDAASNCPRPPLLALPGDCGPGPAGLLPRRPSGCFWVPGHSQFCSSASVPVLGPCLCFRTSSPRCPSSTAATSIKQETPSVLRKHDVPQADCGRQDIPHNLSILILSDVRELGDREEREGGKQVPVRAGGALIGHLAPAPACRCVRERQKLIRQRVQ
eukprot:bmy_18751T0